MTSAPSSAGNVCPNTCEKLVSKRSPKLAVSCCCMGGIYLVAGRWSLAYPNSVSRPPLHIEDHAAATGGTDQPLAFSRVTKAEGPAANTSHGHRGRVPRTRCLFATSERVTDGALLVRVESGRVAHEIRT